MITSLYLYHLHCHYITVVWHLRPQELTKQASQRTMYAFYEEGLTRTKKKIKVWWITYYNLKQCRFIAIKYNDFAVVVVNNPRWRRQNRSSSLEKAWSWMVSRPTISSWVAASSAMIIYGEQGNHLVEWRWEPSLHPESSAHVHCGEQQRAVHMCIVHSGQWRIGVGSA